MKYEITGGNFPVVICSLNAGESMVTQAGGMSWMSANMEMRTEGGKMSRMFGRMLNNEPLFQNIYTARDRPGTIAFASKFPGEIVAFDISPGSEMIFQKSAYLASQTGIDVSTYYHKKFSNGFFSGEGFIMEKVSGRGIVFAEFDGSVIDYELEAGEEMLVNTGCLAAMTSTIDMDARMVSGLENIVFGGEGLTNISVTGPGHVWVQTMPISNMAGVIARNVRLTDS